jgi:hypothetical protein
MDVSAKIRDHSNRQSMCIYVFSPSKNDRLYQVQMETFSDRLLTLTNHNVTIAEVFEHEQSHLGNEDLPSEESTGLRRHYHILPGQFKVVLTSDASVKMSAESCVSCEEVIMRIDNEPAEVQHTMW